MQTQSSTDRSDSSRIGRRGLYLAAAVFVVVLVVAGGSVALVRILDAESIPMSGVDDSGAAAAVGTVEAAYGAFNSGDLKAWWAAREPEAAFDLDDVDVQGFAALIAADGHYEVIGCESHGFGDWSQVQGLSEFAVTTGHRFTCDTILSNSFHNAGGVVLPQTHEWVVADSEVVAMTPLGSRAADDFDDFVDDFRRWLVVNHPEVHASMGYVGVPFPTAESVPTALEYVGLFVEDSPSWPTQTAP